MEKQTLFRNQTLSYDISGQGHPLCLLHGFGEDHNVWKMQVKLLSKQYCIITPDLPGSGKSNLQFSPENHLSLEDHADAIRQIIETENLDAITMIGHSMGGYITLAYAELYPNTLAAMGLVHSTAMPDSSEKKEARRKGIEFTQMHGAGRFLSQVIPNLYGSNYLAQNPEAVAKHIELAQDFTNESVIGYYRAMMERPDRRHILKEFAKPFLYIMGEEDKTVHLQEALSQSYLAAETHVHILKQVGHMGMKEDPMAISSVLSQFMRHVNEN